MLIILGALIHWGPRKWEQKWCMSKPLDCYRGYSFRFVIVPWGEVLALVDGFLKIMPYVFSPVQKQDAQSWSTHQEL